MTVGNLPGDRTYQGDVSFTQKVVLNRSFISDLGEDFTLPIHCSGLLRDRASVGGDRAL